MAKYDVCRQTARLVRELNCAAACVGGRGVAEATPECWYGDVILAPLDDGPGLSPF